MSDLEKDFDYKDEHFDFIQQAVRKFCLQYGASLFYTSVKEDKNCDLLYKYLVHRIYHFPFKVGWSSFMMLKLDLSCRPQPWWLKKTPCSSRLDGTTIRRLQFSMKTCTGGYFASHDCMYLISPFCSVRPDQYYTDVIARPMSGIGRKPVAGRDVEVEATIEIVENVLQSRLWQRRSSSFSPDSSSSCRRVCRRSRVEPCLQVINNDVLLLMYC